MDGMEYEPVIGLEVHAELETRSKMFCACAVVDSTQAEPNIAVCPVCAGMPGMLPVVNQRAVEYGLRVALALECEISPVSIFARKNYFYPDLPKGFQISQYEQPLARHGRLKILTSQGERVISIRRVHLEEDTAKLTHASEAGQAYSLVDLNRAGIPLLEIVTEPDLHTAEEVRAYATALRSLLRYLGVNSGDMQKGVLRIEPNVSVRPVGSQTLGTRTEIKNLNSFRVLERSVAYEIQRQTELLQRGEKVYQETLGWDENRGVTVLQRRKEAEDDYRYFPEPDLPPLVIDPEWLEQIRASLPELPAARLNRFQEQYGLSAYDASVLIVEPEVADYFEKTVRAVPEAAPKTIANWITGDLFGLLNQAGISIEQAKISSLGLAELIRMVVRGEINQNIAKTVLSEMFGSGGSAEDIVEQRGLRQISDIGLIAGLVKRVLDENPEQVTSYLAGKETVSRWLFGQVMRAAQSKANPQVVQQELERQLGSLSKPIVN
jgi:aspartyl-tRNA(Asn)/glutamyl-tRNA(Gln) amidotransferase subunit B